MVDPSPFVRFALHRGIAERDAHIPVGVLSGHWLAMHDWGYGPDVVVLRAAIGDIWPVLLKVRALTRLTCRSVVILDTRRYAAAVPRLLAAGADTVVPVDADVDTLADAAVRSALRPEPPVRTPEAGICLPDRQLQIGCLYASEHGYTASQISTAIGIDPETVRSHLENCRAQFRAHGIDVSSRERLRAVLLEQGHLVGMLGWAP